MTKPKPMPRAPRSGEIVEINRNGRVVMDGLDEVGSPRAPQAVEEVFAIGSLKAPGAPLRRGQS